MPITHGAVRRASGAASGWASFQTTGCLGHTQRKMEGGIKIRAAIDEMAVGSRAEIKVVEGRGGKVEGGELKNGEGL